MDLIQQLKQFTADVRAGQILASIGDASKILAEVAADLAAIAGNPTRAQTAKLKFAEMGQADLDYAVNELESHVLTAGGDKSAIDLSKVAAILLAILQMLLSGLQPTPTPTPTPVS